eukprot:jgi/Bigna1/66477/fgenesh1_pg.1_\
MLENVDHSVVRKTNGEHLGVDHHAQMVLCRTSWRIKRLSNGVDQRLDVDAGDVVAIRRMASVPTPSPAGRKRKRRISDYFQLSAAQNGKNATVLGPVVAEAMEQESMAGWMAVLDRADEDRKLRALLVVDGGSNSSAPHKISESQKQAATPSSSSSSSSLPPPLSSSVSSSDLSVSTKQPVASSCSPASSTLVEKPLLFKPHQEYIPATANIVTWTEFAWGVGRMGGKAERLTSAAEQATSPSPSPPPPHNSPWFLLSPTEHSFITKFQKLAQDSQNLLAETYFCRGPWIRVAQLDPPLPLRIAEELSSSQLDLWRLVRSFASASTTGNSSWAERHVAAARRVVKAIVRGRERGGVDIDATKKKEKKKKKKKKKKESKDEQGKRQTAAQSKGGVAASSSRAITELKFAEVVGGGGRMKMEYRLALDRIFLVFAVCGGYSNSQEGKNLLQADLSRIQFHDSCDDECFPFRSKEQFQRLEAAILRSYSLERAVAKGDADLAYSLAEGAFSRLASMSNLKIRQLSYQSVVNTKSDGQPESDTSVLLGDSSSLQEKHSGSRFSNCPACGVSVAIYLINDHLDRFCRSSTPPPIMANRKRKRYSTGGDGGGSTIIKVSPKAFSRSPNTAATTSTTNSSKRPGAAACTAKSSSSTTGPPSIKPSSSEESEESKEKRQLIAKAGAVTCNGGVGNWRPKPRQFVFIWEEHSKQARQGNPPVIPVFSEVYFCYQDVLRGVLLLERERRYKEATHVLSHLVKRLINSIVSSDSNKFSGAFQESLHRLLTRCGLSSRSSRRSSNKNNSGSSDSSEKRRSSSKQDRCDSSSSRKRRGGGGGGIGKEDEKVVVSPSNNDDNEEEKEDEDEEEEENNNGGSSRETEGGVPLRQVTRPHQRGGSVEDFALEWYRSRGWDGVHSENGPFLTLFMILFWDVVFHPDEMLRFPSVASSEHWRRVRLFLFVAVLPFEIEEMSARERLTMITTGGIAATTEMLSRHYTAYEGRQAFGVNPLNINMCSFGGKGMSSIVIYVNWQVLGGLTGLEQLARGLGSDAVAKICWCYLDDLEAYLGGVPDLYIWRRSSAASPGGGAEAVSSNRIDIKLVEVKGPRDKLSDRQLSWLRVLKAAAVDVEVFRVQG